MPTYEYACASCGNAWEEVQKISEPASTTCPKCKQETAKRQISGGNFILKGGGWYADLYSSTPKKNGAASEKANGASEKSSSDSASSAPSSGSSEKSGSADKGTSSGGGASGGGTSSKE